MTDWIDWHGGEIPVAVKAMEPVEVRFSNGATAVNYAWAIPWSKPEFAAYRVLPTFADLAERDAEIARLWVENGQVCKLVADMHAAAVGEFGCGPKRGVIEDVADVRAEMLRLRAELAQARAVMLFAERVLSDLPSTNQRGTRTEAAYLRLRAAIKGETA